MTITVEFKLRGKIAQYHAVDEAIKTAQFIRNKAIQYWMDHWGADKYDLSRLSKNLAAEFSFVSALNSTARVAACERAWRAISKFYANCKDRKISKNNKPGFKHNSRSVEYKTYGWKISVDYRYITFSDKKGIGTLKLIGTIPLNQYPKEKIKRVRIVKRAGSYYVQFVIDIDKTEGAPFTGSMIGLDVGLKSFYTDSNGKEEPNPKFFKVSEKKIKKLHQRVSKKKKGSSNRKKAIQKLQRGYLKTQRQRKDFVTKLARCVYQSHDLVAIENLNIKNMVKNHCLAKSISDAGWGLFREKLTHYSKVFGKSLILVNPAYTTQECSKCGNIVKKSLSQRTHQCSCGCLLDRDHNSAIVILNRAIQQINLKTTVGHTESNAWGENDLCSKPVVV